MRQLTKNVGRYDAGYFSGTSGNIPIKNILICRPNHRLGNLLLITPLLQEVIAAFPDSKIDLFVKGKLAPTLFRNYSNIDRIIQLPAKPFNNLLNYAEQWIALKTKKYDLVINVDKRSSSGRLSTKFASAQYKFFGDEYQLQHEDYRHIAKCPVYNFRHLSGQLGFIQNEAEIPALNLKLTEAEIAEGKKQLDLIANNSKKTICLFTYATGNKCYSESWWEKFYDNLKREYNDYNIIEILPKENISKISYKEPTFYSKDIRQIGALIANTEAFIGADSGIMHLASAVQTPTIGLFSVTDEKKYEPYNKRSVAINTNKLGFMDCFRTINSVLVPN